MTFGYQGFNNRDSHVAGKTISTKNELRTSQIQKSRDRIKVRISTEDGFIMNFSTKLLRFIKR